MNGRTSCRTPYTTPASPTAQGYPSRKAEWIRHAVGHIRVHELCKKQAFELLHQRRAWSDRAPRAQPCRPSWGFDASHIGDRRDCRTSCSASSITARDSISRRGAYGVSIAGLYWGRCSWRSASMACYLCSSSTTIPSTIPNGSGALCAWRARSCALRNSRAPGRTAASSACSAHSRRRCAATPSPILVTSTCRWRSSASN